MLGNSLRGLVSIQKRCLYRCYILPIALYGFQLWYYNKVPLTYPLKVFIKIQRSVALWISEVFHTSPISDIKAITDFNLYLPPPVKTQQKIPFKSIFIAFKPYY